MLILTTSRKRWFHTKKFKDKTGGKNKCQI
jgi:hypothetical protein